MTERRIWTNKITMQRSDHDLLEYEKGAFVAPLPRLIISPLSFYQFSHTLFSETPILFGKTLYNLAKLPGFARLYGGLPKGITFAKSYEVLPKGITYAKLYLTFAKSFILFGKRTPEQKFSHSQM